MSIVLEIKQSSQYFLRNHRDCMVVDTYKARKRYTVTESLDLIVSVKKRNPVRIFLNQSVIGGSKRVCIRKIGNFSSSVR